uniref:SHSP domain-containing protein n=1 Tax=Trichuris muris TaxID=70415 RepID=A0A5S6R3Y6_TRIMR
MSKEERLKLEGTYYRVTNLSDSNIWRISIVLVPFDVRDIRVQVVGAKLIVKAQQTSNRADEHQMLFSRQLNPRIDKDKLTAYWQPKDNRLVIEAPFVEQPDSVAP